MPESHLCELVRRRRNDAAWAAPPVKEETVCEHLLQVWGGPSRWEDAVTASVASHEMLDALNSATVAHC